MLLIRHIFENKQRNFINTYPNHDIIEYSGITMKHSMYLKKRTGVTLPFNTTPELLQLSNHLLSQLLPDLQ
jgi:hypothetical protein